MSKQDDSIWVADNIRQQMHEESRAGNCGHSELNLGTRYCDHPSTEDDTVMKPCAENYSDCPLHSKDNHESTKKTDKDCPLHKKEKP